MPSTYQSPPTKGTRLFPTPEEPENLELIVNEIEYYPATPMTRDLSAIAAFEKLLWELYQHHTSTNSSA